MKIIKYCHQKINEGWQRSSIHRTLEILVSENNHSKIRKMGFKIMIQLMAFQKNGQQDLVNLFSNVIPIGRFESLPVSDFLISVGADEIGKLGHFKNGNLSSPDSVTNTWVLVDKLHEAEHPTSPSAAHAGPDHIATILPAGVIIPKEPDFSKTELFDDVLSEMTGLANKIAQDALLQGLKF